jgi:hypothetical protein
LALQPTNPYIRAYNEMLIVGEVEQALGRARIYLPSPERSALRTIYLITNTPTSVEIDEIMLLWAEEQSEEFHNLVQAARMLLDDQGSFSRDELRCLSGLSKNSVAERINEIRAELDLVEETGKSNKKIYRKRNRSISDGYLEPQSTISIASH